MRDPFHTMASRTKGIRIMEETRSFRKRLLNWFEDLGLMSWVMLEDSQDALCLTLHNSAATVLVPGADTLGILARIGSDNPSADLEREILIAMMAAPRPFEFPSYQEFASAVRIRANIVDAAKKTQLAFHTEAVERPLECWRYSMNNGFTILHGYPLIDALIKATQPNGSGNLYAFSCYRATEYVILLGIAQELAAVNRDLLDRLQKRWETKAIMSAAFHEAFLVEQGSIEEPISDRYYVPGDRVWFRNPDSTSSEIAGYEGSWVIYLGNGLFSNFWKADAPYTMAHKCLEIFHWRNGVVHDGNGNRFMDEAVVGARVNDSLANPEEAKAIVSRMMRFRDPKGIYANGGCLDASREYPRFVHPKTSDIRLDL